MSGKFCIKLDMTNIFKDERKYTIMMVDPQWPTVKCLLQRIREIYDVPGVLFMTNEGYYVPLEEPIDIIKDCEYLRVIKQEKISNGLQSGKFPLSEEENTLAEVKTAATKSREERNNTQMISHAPTNNTDEDTTSPIIDNNAIVFRCNLNEISEITNQLKTFKPNENCPSSTPTSYYALANYLPGTNATGSKYMNMGGNQGPKVRNNVPPSNNYAPPINNNQYFL